MSHPNRRVEALRHEYQAIHSAVLSIGRKPTSASNDALILRLQAREMEIVDEVRALDLSPDVLVA